MAMYDWNHNGKNDRQDDYLEYMIYKDCTNDINSNTNQSSYNSDSAFGMNVFVVIAVIAIFAFIGNAMEESTPKCIKPGCNNEQTQNSRYCYLHKPYSGGYTSSGSSSSGTVHQAVAHLIRINHIIAAQALQVHHQMYMVMTIAEAIQADQQVVHHITAAQVLMIHMMKDKMISI